MNGEVGHSKGIAGSCTGIAIHSDVRFCHGEAGLRKSLYGHGSLK